jgi:predicted ATP-dependent serine protease
MPRIGEVQRSGREALEIPGLPLLQEAPHGRLVQGDIYLLAGEPAIGKTTLAIPSQAVSPALVVTAYGPDASRWTEDFLRGRS